MSSVNFIFFDFSNQANMTKSLNITNSAIFRATEKYNIPYESSWKALSNDDIFRNKKLKPYQRKSPKTQKLYPRTWYLIEKFLVIVEYYLSLESSGKMLFNGNNFKNDDWNLTIEKPKNPNANPKTWYVNEKF